MNKTKAFNIFTTAGLVAMHMVCCGLPIIAAIFGAASPFAGLVSKGLMNALLVVAGLAVAGSWIVYFKRRETCNKSLLIISTVLLVVMLAMKLFACGGCDH